MTELQKEAYDAVVKINAELYKKYSKPNTKNFNYNSLDSMPILSVVFSNNYTFITLNIPSTEGCIIPEIPLYSSISDDRIYYEKSDKYESFYKYIKRKFIEVKEEIYSVKL